jgi:hypothetical protein
MIAWLCLCRGDKDAGIVGAGFPPRNPGYFALVASVTNGSTDHGIVSRRDSAIEGEEDESVRKDKGSATSGAAKDINSVTLQR